MKISCRIALWPSGLGNDFVCKGFAVHPPVVTGICDPNKSRARHHRSLKLGSKLKYLNINQHKTTCRKVANSGTPNPPNLLGFMA